MPTVFLRVGTSLILTFNLTPLHSTTNSTQPFFERSPLFLSCVSLAFLFFSFPSFPLIHICFSRLLLRFCYSLIVSPSLCHRQDLKCPKSLCRVSIALLLTWLEILSQML
ncbi:uncharacterized protein BO95DRAFT_91208 [Aspergillus brunneoviolaceus CBS 621.78]|uniref:Uncharacterized protein n=1 Tax=Aspergillus brunneoviolaceus CBS 621.78 TaxID=1450534 RepID=A0ACD1GD11_9EURO|nr:hypothetical protein BO95DRAFT_91208 [Aspergillus brunneoviolaceus CBS 621.78]RAH47128.1 hypothetical protein BO95DRAFT_91208 [Aspergillus brunneoviolaceus CBS 621.78]